MEYKADPFCLQNRLFFLKKSMFLSRTHNRGDKNLNITAYI